MAMPDHEQRRPRRKRVGLTAMTTVLIAISAFAAADEYVRVDLSDFKLRLGQDEVLQQLAKTELRLAEAKLYPKVSVGTDWVLDGKIEYSPDVTQDPSSTYAKKDPTSIGLEVTWRLFDGLKNINDIYAAREKVAATVEASLDTKQKLLVERADKMLALARDRAVLASSKRAVARQQEALSISRQMLTDGLMTQSDVAIAASELENLRALTEQASRQLSDSELAFEKFNGFRAPAKLNVAAAKLQIPASAADAADRAMANSPLPKMAAHLQSAADFSVESARGAFFPTIDLVGKYTRTFDPAPAVKTVNNYAVMLRMRLPIFDATLQPNLDRARADALQKSYDRQDTMLSVTMGARKYFDGYKSLKIQVGRLEARVGEASKAQSAMQEEMKAGLHTVLDLIQTQRNLISAEQSLADARYMRDMSAFNLLATMGDLDESAFGGSVKTFDPSVKMF
jgi:outer membrane protein TolC